ncbi:MAG: glycoside hydrolase family 10 protein, partial [Phormidesmis sp.]
HVIHHSQANQSQRPRLQAFLSTLPVIALCLVLTLWSPSQQPNETPNEISNEISKETLIQTQLSAPKPAQVSVPRFAQVPSEIRGVWITNVASTVLFAPWGIPRAVRQLSDLQFNTVYPVVWNRGKTFYHSPTLRQITGHDIAPVIALTHPTEDPLVEMARVGHRANLRVIPWFEYGFMVPLHSRLAREHPDWLTTRRNGSQQLHETSLTGNRPDKHSLLSHLLNPLLNSGAPKSLGWLNPLHPEVQQLVLDLVTEVVSQYDIEGIQFDDHFSLPVEFGYDPYTVALYLSEHEGQRPPEDVADEAWIRWRADRFSQFVGVLHSRIKENCPTCLVSLSPNPAKFAYRFHLQDWRTWVSNHWIDELVVQVYRDELTRFEGELAKETLQSTRDQIPVSIGILTGTWRRPIPFEQIKEQVISSRDHHFSGVAFFYWDTLWSYFTPESPQKRRQNFRELLAER